MVYNSGGNGGGGQMANYRWARLELSANVSKV